jgi:hypothetical protein
MKVIMILSAHQPQYLAYTGYFDKMDQADIFVLLDTVQYKKNEWINRNRLKGPNGVQFITVPVSFNFGDRILEAKIAPDPTWRKKHLQTLRTLYAKTAYFQEFYKLLEDILAVDTDSLSELNILTVTKISHKLGIKTRLEIASSLPEMPEDPDRRLIALCRHFNCDTYLAGSGGKDYMNLEVWKNSGVEVVFHHFVEPTRKQLYSPFEPNLSIADLYMNEGGKSMDILRNAR